MPFGKVLTRLYDTLSSILISAMTQLCDIFSFVLMHIIIGKKKKKTTKNISCWKTTVSVFICLCFSMKQTPVLQSILLIVHVLLYYFEQTKDSKEAFATRLPIANSKNW